jgi:hypothetical protein
MGQGQGVYRGKLLERDHWEDPGEDGRIILKWISGSGMLGYGLDWAGLE